MILPLEAKAPYLRAIQALKTRFPYWKRRTGTGEFCGAFYRQDRCTLDIRMSQQAFAQSLKPANPCKGQSTDPPFQKARSRC